MVHERHAFCRFRMLSRCGPTVTSSCTRAAKAWHPALQRKKSIKLAEGRGKYGIRYDGVQQSHPHFRDGLAGGTWFRGQAGVKCRALSARDVQIIWWLSAAPACRRGQPVDDKARLPDTRRFRRQRKQVYRPDDDGRHHGERGVVPTAEYLGDLIPVQLQDDRR